MKPAAAVPLVQPPSPASRPRVAGAASVLSCVCGAAIACAAVSWRGQVARGVHRIDVLHARREDGRCACAVLSSSSADHIEPGRATLSSSGRPWYSKYALSALETTPAKGAQAFLERRAVFRVADQIPVERRATDFTTLRPGPRLLPRLAF